MKMPDMNESGIIESGSNENGHWTKFSDGTLICYKNYVDAEANSTSVVVTLANTFIDNDYIVMPVNAYANSVNIFWGGGANTTNTATLYPRKYNGDVIDKLERCNYIAIRSLEIKKKVRKNR